jgi:hypothetical protein
MTYWDTMGNGELEEEEEDDNVVVVVVILFVTSVAD